MNTGFKFHLRFTGPFLRFEHKNNPGVFVSADRIEEIVQEFAAAVQHEAEIARAYEAGGMDAVRVVNAKRQQQREECAND